MEKSNNLINQKIETINAIIKKEAFYDIEVLKMTGVDLIIAGSTNFTYSHTLEIVFKDVFHMSLNLSWTLDTP